ncbi:MAG: hypothetical protein LBP33_02825 [Candidatus Adiutrix sp.]|jgi:hypothetical protein|nr:hypothetical protein [Candidatus Adiutrix sp.]
MTSSSRLLVLALLALVMMNGCSGKLSRGQGHMYSFVSESLPADQAETLADRLAASLAEIFPPGHTSLFLTLASDQDALGAAFDQALRSRGFALAAEASDQALTVAYAADQVDEQTWYTRLAISGGPLITRAYLLADGQLTEGAAAMRAGGDHGQR